MCVRTAVLMRKANALNRFSMKPGKSSQVLCGEQVGFALWQSWGGSTVNLNDNEMHNMGKC